MNRATAAIVTCLAAGITAADDSGTFSNASVGFAVTKPPEWRIVVADRGDPAARRADPGERYAAEPLLVMARHAEPFDDLNPTFRVNIRPLGELEGTSATSILKMIAPQFEQMFDDYSLAQAPKKVKVSGMPAGYMRVDYTIGAPDGRRFPTASEVWIVPRGAYFFMIGAATRQDEATGARSEIDSIMKSVRIDP